MRFEGMKRYTQYLNWYVSEVNKERISSFMFIISFVVLLVTGLLLPTVLTRCDDIRVVKPDVKTAYYENLFKQNGSTEPKIMAKAVLATKKPKLMAAIAIKESNGNPKAVGDNGASKGAFQVQAKHWGTVSNDPVKQALQSERILEELALASRGRLRQTLAMYNGGNKPSKSAYRYADDVIRKVNSI
jgi:hypothetical protein